MTSAQSMRARAERLIAPGYSWCFHCGRPWKFVKGHTTDYGDGHGCFPLCETCWSELETPEARLPYYRVLWNSWIDSGSNLDPGVWERIEAAVRAGR